MVKLKNIWNHWFWKNEILSRNEGINVDDKPMGWNIYVPADTKRKDFAKQFYKVHGRFKYRFVVPLLIIARKFFLPKYQHEGVVKKNMYNREWVVFERAFNLALEDMATILFYNQNRRSKLSKAEIIKQLQEDPEYYSYMKIVKQGVLYISMMDSAYHEFGVFFMHRVAQEMNKEFEGEEYNRVVYNSGVINDVNWLVIQQSINKMSDGFEIEVVSVKEGEEYEWEIKKDAEEEGRETTGN
jgi:hypothetical protein